MLLKVVRIDFIHVYFSYNLIFILTWQLWKDLIGNSGLCIIDVCLSVRPSVCLSVCPSVSPSVCLSVSQQFTICLNIKSTVSGIYFKHYTHAYKAFQWGCVWWPWPLTLAVNNLAIRSLMVSCDYTKLVCHISQTNTLHKRRRLLSQW